MTVDYWGMENGREGHGVSERRGERERERD